MVRDRVSRYFYIEVVVTTGNVRENIGDECPIPEVDDDMKEG